MEKQFFDSLNKKYLKICTSFPASEPVSCSPKQDMYSLFLSDAYEITQYFTPRIALGCQVLQL